MEFIRFTLLRAHIEIYRTLFHIVIILRERYLDQFIFNRIVICAKYRKHTAIRHHSNNLRR